jgi:hypothetical protein
VRLGRGSRSVASNSSTRWDIFRLRSTLDRWIEAASAAFVLDFVGVRSLASLDAINGALLSPASLDGPLLAFLF